MKQNLLLTMKKMNNRNVAAFDVVMDYLERNPEIKKRKYPVNVTLKTRYISIVEKVN